MFFTQEDYKKIYEWISRNSIKDTEFNEALTPLDETDTITLIQNGANVRISLKDLIDQLFQMGVSDFLNITDKYGEKNITLAQAIELIPYTARKVGQVITFLDKNNRWKIYQFKGELTQWDQLNLWEDILDIEAHTINSILPDEEDLTKSLPDDKGNSYLSFKDREYNPDDFSGLGRIILRKNIVEIEDPIYGKIKKNVLYQDMITQSNTIYEIRYDFDLNGAKITIPEGCVLDFQGGSLSNGTIIGNDTNIINNLNKTIFNNTTFGGKFIGFKVYSSWFNIKYNQVIDNSKELISAINLSKLTDIKTIIINGGIIYLDAREDNKTSGFEGKLKLYSNCHLIIDNNTSLKVIPNNYNDYSIIYAEKCDNIIIEGGSIIGDIVEHEGTTGEWGYGIAFCGVSNSVIKNITLKDCWGDGIILEVWKDRRNNPDDLISAIHNYNIIIDNVNIDRNRRNGISVSGIDRLIIQNSTISNSGQINPTLPNYAIDIEADIYGNHINSNIIIDNIYTYGNIGGGVVTQAALNNNTGKLNINNVTLKNSNINELIQFQGYDINIINNKGKYVYIHECQNCNVLNNKIENIAVYDHRLINDNINIINNYIYKTGKYYSISWTTKCKNYNIKNNIIKFDTAPNVLIYVNSENMIKIDSCIFEYNGEPIAQINNMLKSLFINCIFNGFGNANIFGCFYNNNKLKIHFYSDKNISIKFKDKNTSTVYGNRNLYMQGTHCQINRTGNVYTNIDYNYFNDAYFFPIKTTFLNNSENKNELEIIIGYIKNDKYYVMTIDTLGSDFDINLIDRDDSIKPLLRNSKINSLDDINDIFRLSSETKLKQNLYNSYVEFNSSKRVMGQGVLLFNELPALSTYYKGITAFYKDKPIWWTGSKWVDATGADV